MPNNPYVLPKGIASADGDAVAGVQTTIDSSTLSQLTATNAQELAAAVNQLSSVVAGLQPGEASPRGEFIPFTGSTTIAAGNYDVFEGRTALYARSDNARVNFIMPTEAVINNRYPVTFQVLNQAGTGRFDTGFTPTNTVVIDVQGSDTLRRGTSTGALLNFIEAHQNDLVTITKSAAGEPWVANRVTLSSAALLLPNGLFHLQVGRQISANPALTGLAGFNVGEMPSAGDAYTISTGNDDFGGYGVATGDVIVALIDNPSRLNSASNDDWLVIRNATNDIITLDEIRFLNAVTEVDSFSDSRLVDRSDVNNVRLWLSPFILDHAPFISPSTDPNNPQSGETGEYIGGDEADTATSEFDASSAQLGDFTNTNNSSRAPSALVYIDIDGSLSGSALTTVLNNTFMVIKDLDGNEISRFNLATQFRAITLPGSGDTYYVFDTVGAADNYSSINYQQGQSIDVVQRNTNRAFNLSDSINVIPALKDGSIPLSKLNNNVQALIQSDHSLTDAQEVKLAGLETSGTPTVWTAGDLYVKDNDASSSNDLSHYVNVGQQNGILANFEGTRSITFLVPNFVSVTNLTRVDDNTQTVAVTPIGTILGRQAFTAVLPESSFDINNPAGTAWAVNGMASNLQLSGANPTFKIDRENLDSNLDNAIFDQTPESSLPAILTQWGDDLTRTTTTDTGWRSLPKAAQFGLQREAAKLWDENLRNDTGNYFDDITGTEFIGYNANNIFFYGDGDNPANRSFPGFQSYILNDNVRVRNTGSNTNIGNGAHKIIMFDYSLQRNLTTGDNQSMVRLGGTSATPLVGLSHDEGLFLNIGGQDGGTRTRTYFEHEQVDGGHWHDGVDDGGIIAEAETIIPSSATGSFQIRIDIQLDNNGNDEGTHSETVTITNVAADQNLGQRTFSFAGYPSVTVNLVYDHDNNDLSNTRRVLFIRPTTAFTNAALTYNVSVLHSVTETWTAPTTYARYPINSGNPHDRFGLFDPALWNTERLRTPEHVALMLRPYRLGDTSSDPEMAVYAVIDGEHEGDPSRDGRLIRLHRPLSDFTTNDVSIGNNIVGVSHLQMYRYDSNKAPTEAQFYQLVSNEDSWLRAFTNADDTTDTFTLNGNLEVTQGKTFILSASPNNTRVELQVDDNDANNLVLSVKAITP